MNSPWQAGSKAVCVRKAPWRFCGTAEVAAGPVNDGKTVYAVESVMRQCGMLGLWIVGYQGWWDADDFRPIVSTSERVSATAEVTA